MNKIVRADDIEYIGVDICALIKKCPDLSSDMLFALLSLRGDISRADFKDVIRLISNFSLSFQNCNWIFIND
jgi:hypothetical protein